MKNSYRNLLVLTAAVCFLAFNFGGASASAENGERAKHTPTPKATPKPKAAAKTTKTASKPAANAKPQSTPKKAADAKKSDASKKTDGKKSDAKSSKNAADGKDKSNQKTANAAKSDAKNGGQIIITATNVTVRREATAKSVSLASVKLGKVLPVIKKGSSFYQVEYENGKQGWVATTYTRDFDADKREAVYRDIGDKYLKTQKFDYSSAAEVTEFFRTAQALVKTDAARAELAYKRLQFIQAALKAIPYGKGEQFPYKTFVKANEKDIVYSEPSAEWYVRTESLWDLQGKYTALPIAEEIAWTAANTLIPGECEGYINCYLYNIRSKDGEYLNFYPNGKYAQKALTDIGKYLDPFVADIKEKAVYKSPSDISDRAEFNRFLTELRAIVSKTPNIEKNKVLKQINDLGEGYK